MYLYQDSGSMFAFAQYKYEHYSYSTCNIMQYKILDWLFTNNIES